MKQTTRFEHTQRILSLVNWLRDLGPGECSETTLYLVQDKTGEPHYALGATFYDGDTKPPELGTRYLPIIRLDNLPPKRIARFLKLHRKWLAKLAIDLTNPESAAQAELSRVGLSAHAEAWRKAAIAAPAVPPTADLKKHLR